MDAKKYYNTDNNNQFKVLCRFRPLTSAEKRDGYHNIVQIDEKTKTNCQINCKDFNGQFEFDRVFGSTAVQAEVFDYIGQDLIDQLVQGFDTTFFCYGQTGSGKTHTIMGNPDSISDPKTRGLLPRLVEQIFKQIIRKSLKNIEIKIEVSFMEVYMDRVRDLLSSSAESKDLKIQEDQEKRIYIKGLKEFPVGNEEAVFELIDRGNATRMTAANAQNDHSSRSHTIFVITITQKDKERGVKTRGRLHLVDLAGSESVSKTKAVGKMLEEAKHINKELAVLGSVIDALADRNAHVPYRHSKLTRILQESLGGNSKTIILINCSSSSDDEAETVSTLRFGSRAKLITNRTRAYEEPDFEDSPDKKQPTTVLDRKIDPNPIVKRQPSPPLTLQVKMVDENTQTATAVDSSSETIKSIRDENVRLCQIIDEKYEEIEIYFTKLEKLSKELDAKEMQITTITSTKDEQIKILQNDNEKFRKQTEELKIRISEIGRESENKNDQLPAEPTALSDETKLLREENDKMHQQVEELEEQIKVIGGESEEKATKITQLTNELDSAKTEEVKLKKKIEELLTTIQSLELRIKKFEQEKNNVIAVVPSKQKQMEKSIERELQDRLQAVNIELESKIKLLLTVEAELQQFKEQETRYKSQAEELQRKVKMLEEEKQKAPKPIKSAPTNVVHPSSDTETGIITVVKQYRKERGSSSIPTGLILFICGFFLPPFWWAGAFMSDSAMRGGKDYSWRGANRLISIISLVAITVVGSIFLPSIISQNSINNSCAGFNNSTTTTTQTIFANFTF